MSANGDSTAQFNSIQLAHIAPVATSTSAKWAFVATSSAAAHHSRARPR